MRKFWRDRFLASIIQDAIQCNLLHPCTAGAINFADRNLALDKSSLHKFVAASYSVSYGGS